MHERQLTIVEVSDEVRSNSKHDITALRTRKRRESVKCNVNELSSLTQVKKRMRSFPRDLIDAVKTEKARWNYFILVKAESALLS